MEHTPTRCREIAKRPVHCTPAYQCYRRYSICIKLSTKSHTLSPVCEWAVNPMTTRQNAAEARLGMLLSATIPRAAAARWAVTDDSIVIPPQLNRQSVD